MAVSGPRATQKECVAPPSFGAQLWLGAFTPWYLKI